MLRKTAANVPGLEAAVADGKKAHQALQSEAQALRDATTNLEKSLAATRKENALAEEEIDALKRQCAAVAAELAAAQQARASDTKQIAGLQKAVARLETAMKKSDEQHASDAADAVALRARIAQQDLRISVRASQAVLSLCHLTDAIFPSARTWKPRRPRRRKLWVHCGRRRPRCWR